MRNSKRVISTLSILLCLLLVFCGCSNTVKCSWEFAGSSDEIVLHTADQSAYLAGDYNKISSYAKADKELSRPVPAQFAWTATPAKELAITGYTVEIQDCDNRYATLTFDTATPTLDVYNLCIGTEYLWRVTAHYENGKTSTSGWSYFATEDVAPRNLYVDGITNVRDLGGWHTTDGGRVRQGMIFRCGRLNESERPDVVIEITEAGIDMMRNVLGIRSEIDLRMPNKHDTETGGITSSPLGEDVNYYNCPLDWDQGNYMTYNLASVKKFFELASDESNYPFIFHCNIGTDRTGMFAFLINGLLGVAEEDLYRDYLFSNFGAINNHARTLSNIQNNYLKTINQYPGATLSERIENCLLDLVGVPQEQLDAIRDIMMER